MFMKDIKKFLDSRIGDYSFYFEDLSSGYVYAMNENVRMPAAGSMKLPIAIALFKEVQPGKIDINMKVKVKAEDMVYSTGILHEFSERDYSVKELLTAMLLHSDNTAANKLIDIIGMDRINEIIRDMRLANTVLNRKSIDERKSHSEVQNYTSAMDLSKCWRILYNETFVDKENSRIIIDILKRQQLKNKLSYYYPERIKREIANKTGDIDNVENDTALMSINKGSFIITVMSSNLPNNVYGQITLARVGKMALDIIEAGWD